jgi:hypothetical protein
MSFEKNKAKLRKRLINEGKIDVDMTKENKEQKLSDSAERSLLYAVAIETINLI